MSSFLQYFPFFSCKPSWIFLMLSTKLLFFSTHFLPSIVLCQLLTSCALKLLSRFIWAILNKLFKKIFSQHWFLWYVNFRCTGNVSRFIHYVLCNLSPIYTWWFNLLLFIMLVVQLLKLVVIFSVLYYAFFHTVWLNLWEPSQ